MSDDDEAETSSSNFKSTLNQLSRLVRVPRYDRPQAKALVDRIVKIGNEQGFSDEEATRILQLALHTSTYNGRSISKQISILLIRSIYPASGEQYGDEFVLTIIGALGPADDAIVDSNPFMVGEQVRDVDTSSASENDEAESSDRGKQRRRVRLDVGVQAAAIRLLLLLLSPPSIMSVQVDIASSNRAENFDLPASFLTNKARRRLDRSYDILFHFLDYQTLRPYISHILSLTTRRKHVRHHRIVKLISLRNMAPDDIRLEALITTCSKYYPDIYPVNAAPSSGRLNSHAGGIKYPDSKWLIHVHSIWNKSSVEEHTQDNLKRPQKRRKEHHSSKSRKRNLTIASHTRSPAEILLPATSVLSVQEGKLLLTEIMSYKGLGYTFDRLQLPSHLVCALNHDMLAVSILARADNANDEVLMARIGDWAMSALSEEMNLPSSKTIKTQERRSRSEASLRKSSSVLLLFGEFIERMGACTPTMQRWTNRLLHPQIWRSLSIEEKSSILGIIESFVPNEWMTFFADTLDPLKVIMSTCSAEEAALITDALRRLLENWVKGRNWVEICNTLDNEAEEVFIGFQRLNPSINYVETIMQTIKTVIDFTSTLLLRMPHSLDIMGASLGLYECLSTTPFIGLHGSSLPPSYSLHLASLTAYGSVFTLSNLFGIMKQILDLHVGMGADDDSLDESMVTTNGVNRIKEQRSIFNGDDAKDAFNDCSVYLTDLIWRSNAFGTVPGDRVYDLGPPKEFISRFAERCNQRGDQLVQVGSITHSATLATLVEAHSNTLVISSRKYIRGPVTAYILEKSSIPISYNHLRDSHLDWLADRGAVGLRNFFHSTISRFREAQLQSSFRDQSRSTMETA